ncbi:MAG: PTS sugar transporter subunit IIA [Deltaproteobacteria bacterium]|nr:PTS sugar transporter subunit IIA [Deltaproteobacteria bacterium]
MGDLARPEPATSGRTESGARLEAFDLQAKSRSEVLARVASETRGRCPRVDAGALLAALERREADESSSVGDGIALPHASVDGLDAPMLMDVSLERPVRWGEDAVSRCMVLLVPRGDTLAHLGLAADAARRAGAG